MHERASVRQTNDELRGSIHELFELQVARAPAATALVDGERAVSYAELNARANRLARLLIERGARFGQFIGIQMPRCADMIAAEIAVLKMGGTYVPLDPALPPERRAFVVRDSNLALIVLDRAEPEDCTLKGVEWIRYASESTELKGFSTENLRLPSLATAPAYVMYTSGTTGQPKGAIVPHCGVIRLAIDNGYARIGPSDRLAHCSNPAFDASTFEIWGALLNGASVLIVPQHVLVDAASFGDLLREQHVTVMFLTVGLFVQYVKLLAQSVQGLRYLLVGGDVVDPQPMEWLLRHAPALDLRNAYGPTECTTFSTTYRMSSTDEGAKTIPIGQPIAETQVHILDDALRPVPSGAVGEIYVGGRGICLGYLARPSLTAERFIADPFSGEASARLYRTGDLARRRDDGNIEFVGRSDRQIKLRGFRIELEEIEAALMSHPNVEQAAVLVQQDSHEEKFLAAYVARNGTNALCESRELHRHLQQFLPAYMLPRAYAILDRLPLTATGKLDRRALPAATIVSHSHVPYESPRGSVERFLAELWQDVLRIEKVGRQDNFFELGGNSLLGIKMFTKVSQRLQMPPIRSTVFQCPTVEAMASIVGGSLLSEGRCASSTSDAAVERGVL